VEYLRVLPFANGLPSWEPAPAAWHGGAGAWPPPSAPATADQLETYAEEVVSAGFRSQAAFVDGKIAGGSALLSLQLTVPGLRQIPMGGVTSTGVVATHRRRGLLRAMMAAMFADARDHGESVLGLSASEGSIYGRFGFSPATLRARWELERTQAEFLQASPHEGALELVSADVARNAWPALHEQARRHRVGEVSAQSGRWASLGDDPDGTDGPVRIVIHRDADGVIDGIANYRLPWSADESEVGTLVVEAFEATSVAAYSAIWRLLSDFDLTRRVVAAGRPFDEPLRWMLRNPRALRVTRSSDNLWIRVLDVGAALRARTYGTDGVLTLAIAADAMCPENTGVWRLEACDGGADCGRADMADPDVTMDISALGSLYLGGASPGTLAAAGRITQHRAGAVPLLARLFPSDPAPFNSIGF
ncbi:MAG TPA: GNAT family N-acetyltransferase, partial [Streptosporangiaceae bacterium]